MTERPPSKDEALEALDFIVNVLKEHEKDLDGLVSELGTVADQMGETGELTAKVEKIETKITNLQNDVSKLVKYLSTTPKEPPTPLTTPTTQEAPAAPATTVKQPENNNTLQLEAVTGTPMLFQCKQWEDFQTLAAQAQMASFTIKETENAFEATALKNNQIIKFTGEIPKITILLKNWLSKELQTPEKKVLEGILAIG